MVYYLWVVTLAAFATLRVKYNFQGANSASWKYCTLDWRSTSPWQKKSKVVTCTSGKWQQNRIAKAIRPHFLHMLILLHYTDYTNYDIYIQSYQHNSWLRDLTQGAFTFP